MSKTSLSTEQELRKGESLVSSSGEYEAILQFDNNFVIYKKYGGPIWATATNSKNPFRLLLQGDGNLVMYTQDCKPVWHTNTAGKCSNRIRLTLTNEGHLVLDSDAQTIWSSQSSSGRII